MPYQKKFSKNKNNKDPQSFFKINRELKFLVKKARDLYATPFMGQILNSNKLIEFNKKNDIFKNLLFYRDFILCPDLNPIDGQVINFSRASAAIQIDNNGLPAYGPENLLLRSEAFNVSWTSSRASPYLMSDSPINIKSPIQTYSATQLVEDSSVGSTHEINQTVSTALGVHTFSVYVKAKERFGVRLDMTDLTTADVYADFDLTSGQIVSTSQAGSWTSSSASINALPNGWYRISLTAIRGAGTSQNVKIQMLDSGYSAIYDGDGLSSIYVWGAQLERYSSARSYLITTSSSYYGPRFTYDTITKNPLGLLIEESRTNLITYSEFTGWTGSPSAPVGWIANTGSVWASDIGVNGKYTAARTTAASSNPNGALGANASTVFISGSTYSISAWFKRNTSASGSIFIAVDGTGSNVCQFDTTNMPVGSWVRLSTTFVASSSSFASFRFHTNGSVLDITIDKVQIELGAFASSYIPTVGASATRSTDIVNVNTKNLYNFYRQDEGTIYIEAFAANTSVATILTIDDNSLNNRIYIQLESGSASRAVVAVGGSNVANLTNLSSTSVKAALAIKTDDFSFSCSGSAVSTDNLGALPSPVIMRLGAAPVNGYGLYGTIARIFYFNKRLSNSILQEISS
jgi:hypothetical protein